MHNICFKQDLSLSFNDSSYLFHETNPLSVSSSSSPPKCCICCCYCCCCTTDGSMCNSLASMNPNFLYKGLSQSTLIQWSFCKRLIYLHGKSRRSYGNTYGVSSFTDLDRSYYHEKLSSFKEKPKQGRLVKGGYEFRGLGHKKKKQFLSNVSEEDNVEVMLSLLTDEMGLEDIGVCDGNQKKNVVPRVAKSAKRDLKCDEVVKVKSIEKGDDDWSQRKERKAKKMQNLPKTANLDSSKEGLNCSIESGKDFEVKSEGCIDEVVRNVDGRQECDKEEVKVLDKKDNVKGCYGDSVGVSQDWRKKSEKKLNEEFSQHQSNVFVNIRQHQSTVSVNIGDSSRQERSYEVDRFTDESGSRMKYKRFKETSGKDYSVMESTSRSQKQNKETEKKLEAISEVSKSRMNIWEENSPQVSDGVKDSREEKNQKTDHLIRLTTSSREKSQKMLEISDTHLTNSGNTSFSHRKSDVRMEKQKRHSEASESKVSDNCLISMGVSDIESRKSNEEGEQDNGSRNSSQGSGPKGPSDEMWHVTDASESPSYSSENDGAIKIEELERRKLVSIDRFGWEEAYALEAKQRKNDEKFMREALLEAKKASDMWEVPVGAVLVQGDKIIARGHNLVEELHDSTAHAEMICIREASTNLRSWRLLDTTLYVTLEPCPMCAGAILQARVDTIVWGAPNKLLGADGSWIRLFGDGDGENGSIPTDQPPAPAHPFHPNMVVRRGVLAAECGEVMQHFFRLRRKKKTEPEPEPPAPPSSHHSNFLSKIHHAFNIIFCL